MIKEMNDKANVLEELQTLLARTPNSLTDLCGDGDDLYQMPVEALTSESDLQVHFINHVIGHTWEIKNLRRQQCNWVRGAMYHIAIDALEEFGLKDNGPIFGNCQTAFEARLMSAVLLSEALSEEPCFVDLVEDLLERALQLSWEDLYALALEDLADDEKYDSLQRYVSGLESWRQEALAHCEAIDPEMARFLEELSNEAFAEVHCMPPVVASRFYPSSTSPSAFLTVAAEITGANTAQLDVG